MRGRMPQDFFMESLNDPAQNTQFSSFCRSNQLHKRTLHYFWTLEECLGLLFLPELLWSLSRSVWKLVAFYLESWWLLGDNQLALAIFYTEAHDLFVNPPELDLLPIWGLHPAAIKHCRSLPMPYAARRGFLRRSTLLLRIGQKAAWHTITGCQKCKALLRRVARIPHKSPNRVCL